MINSVDAMQIPIHQLLGSQLATLHRVVQLGDARLAEVTFVSGAGNECQADQEEQPNIFCCQFTDSPISRQPNLKIEDSECSA